MKKLLTLLTIFLASGKCFAADVGQVIIPAWPTQVISASYNNHTLDAADDQIEFMIQCEEACAIDGIQVRQGAVSGTPPTYEARIEGVNSSGRADGTVKSSTNAKGDLTLNGANTVATATLTSSYTCTKGEFLALVVDYRTGSLAGNASFSYSNANALGYRFPMAWTVDATVATYRAGIIPVSYKCGSTYYGFLPETSGQFDFGSLSNPDERGNKFTIPASSCSTFKIDGARWNGYMNASGSTLEVSIYEGTTARQNTALDTDYDTSGGSAGYLKVDFDESYTFTCGTEYIVAIKPNSASGVSTGLQYINVDTNAGLNSMPLGTTMSYVGRQDAGSWDTTDTTRRALIDLIISDITEPASGGVMNLNQVSGGSQ